MSNDRHDMKQLALDFESGTQSYHFCQDASSLATKASISFHHLSLIVDNSLQVQCESTALEPNSPEITRIIRDLGKALSW